jgi:hypothetical protein
MTNVLNLNACVLNKESNMSFPLFKNSLPILLPQHAEGLSDEHDIFMKSRKVHRVTPDDIIRLNADIKAIIQRLLLLNPKETKKSVTSFGIAGSGQEFVLLNEWTQHLSQKQFVYISPEGNILPQMFHTFWEDATERVSGKEDGGEDPVVSQESYAKSRDYWHTGCKFATTTVLDHLIKKDKPFCFQAGSSTKFVKPYLESLKERGYTVKIIYVGAHPSECRKVLNDSGNSMQPLDSTQVLALSNDARKLASSLHEMLLYAHVVDLYFRINNENDPILVARMMKDRNSSSPVRGKICKASVQIIDHSGYQSLKKSHDLMVNYVKRPDLRWDNMVLNETFSSNF